MQWYLHNHAVGAFTNVGQIPITWSDLKHLTPDNLRVRIGIVHPIVVTTGLCHNDLMFFFCLIFCRHFKRNFDLFFFVSFRFDSHALYLYLTLKICCWEKHNRNLYQKNGNFSYENLICLTNILKWQLSYATRNTNLY